jgi:hypothetical protein
VGETQTDRTVCPFCGHGWLIDVSFDGGTGEGGPGEEPKQLADSSEVDVYSCGHEVSGASLDRADRSLGVEMRTSDEPVGDPTPEEEHRRTLDETV